MSVSVLLVLVRWALYPFISSSSALPLSSVQFQLRTLLLTLQSASSPVFLDGLRGSALLPLYLRLLGARVAPSAFIDTLRLPDADHVVIGESAAISGEACLATATVDTKGKALRRSTICVEKGARLGIGAVVMAGARVGMAGELGDSALLPPSCALAGGDRRFGSDILAGGAGEEEAGKPPMGVARTPSVVLLPVQL